MDLTIRDIRAYFDPAAQACHHDAIFGLAYLRTTEAYRRAVSDPAFFRDNAWVNKEDWWFAVLYLDAARNWDAGRLKRVPPAWRVAFQNADARAVNGGGDLLLGMNAHINRDLPFVLDQMGLVAPDGSSRKADHDRVNTILEGISQAVVEELSRRFDPSIQTTYIQGTTLDDKGVFQLVVAWRERAWQNAVALATAPTPEARELQAARIEQEAYLQALAIAAESAYVAPLSSTAARDAYCAQHWDDR